MRETNKKPTESPGESLVSRRIKRTEKKTKRKQNVARSGRVLSFYRAVPEMRALRAQLEAHLAAPPRGELIRGGVRVALVGEALSASISNSHRGHFLQCGYRDVNSPDHHHHHRVFF